MRLAMLTIVLLALAAPAFACSQNEASTSSPIASTSTPETPPAPPTSGG